MSVTADGTRVTGVATSPVEEQHGSWSPDGNRIAFSGGGHGGDLYQVLSRRARGTTPRGNAAATDERDWVDPKWSPDGRSIVYTRRGEVWLMRSDGSDDRALVTKLDSPGTILAQYAIWSPDGKTIYVKAAGDERKASIWSVPASGGTPRLLMRLTIRAPLAAA